MINAKAPARVSAGVFKVDDRGNSRIQFTPTSRVESADKLAVTLERQGGVPKPEGTMVLLGSTR